MYYEIQVKVKEQFHGVSSFYSPLYEPQGLNQVIVLGGMFNIHMTAGVYESKLASQVAVLVKTAVASFYNLNTNLHVIEFQSRNWK